MHRTLEPELLDSLPPSDPEALRNRRDLRLTNLVMGNHAWVSATLRRRQRQGERVIELGAGTGELGGRLARRGIIVDGLDLWPRPPAWPSAARWHQADLRSFDRWREYPVILGNLIFHQFSEVELRALGRQLQHARVILACEPARRRASQLAYRTLAPLFGANAVSLHDAHVSIAAGFRGRELADALTLDGATWEVACTSTFMGAYRMIAQRRR